MMWDEGILMAFSHDLLNSPRKYFFQTSKNKGINHLKSPVYLTRIELISSKFHITFLQAFKWCSIPNLIVLLL